MTIYIIRNMKGVAMSDENNKKNGPVFLVGGLVLLAIAGLVYMSLKQEVAPAA
jgi:hypothetical protein